MFTLYLDSTLGLRIGLKPLFIEAIHDCCSDNNKRAVYFMCESLLKQLVCSFMLPVYAADG